MLRYSLHALFRRFLSGLSLWLMLRAMTACTAPEDRPPDNLIAEDRMADVLTEIHVAENRVTRMGLRSADSSKIVYKHLEAQIFKKYNVDTAAYTKSYVFYASHPAEMEAIYKRVVEKLQTKLNPKTQRRS